MGNEDNEEEQKDYIHLLYMARIKRNMTVFALSRRLKVEYNTLHSWENKKRKPRYDAFLKWCKFLKVEIDVTGIN